MFFVVGREVLGGIFNEVEANVVQRPAGRMKRRANNIDKYEDVDQDKADDADDGQAAVERIDIREEQ